MNQNFLKTLASKKVPLKIYNPSYNRYLFVSNDKEGRDHVVEAHGPQYIGEERNNFFIEDCNNGRFRIYNPKYSLWLFVSNDKKGADNIVEAHSSIGEDRNQFELQFVSENRFKIFNPSYNRFIFVSNDKKGPDNVIEAHPHDETRNIFSFILPDPVSYSLIDVKYVIPSIPLEQPFDELQQLNLSNPENIETTISGTASKTYTHTKSWTSQIGIKVGISTKINAGIPFIADGQIQISAESSFSHTWGETVTESRTFSQVISAKIPPKSNVIANYRLWIKKLAIPYTATMIVHYSGAFGEGDYEQSLEGVYDSVEASILKVEFFSSGL